MPYGSFVYGVERTQIVEPTALWVKRKVGYDRLSSAPATRYTVLLSG